MVLMIWSRIPCTMDAIAITVATPMTTPRIVSAERSLLARSWSSAMSQPSETDRSLMRPCQMRNERNPECGVRNAELKGEVRSSGPAAGIDGRTTDSAFRIPHSALVSFVSQCYDRIQPRGPHRGVDAEHDADAPAEAQGERDRPAGDARRQGGDDRDEAGEADAAGEAEQAPQPGQRPRLGANLDADVW